MKYTTLSGTDVKVSVICLGTMTWGQQNTEVDAHEQMDYAVSQGVNFFDTAELYAIPINPETQGLTEKYIGNWLAANGNRKKLVIATKAAGPGPQHIRKGPNFSKEHLKQAIEESLERLQTDYIDLYQLHWPERKTNMFGDLGYRYGDEPAVTNFQEVLAFLKTYIDQGIIKNIGISNETPWGMMQYLKTAEMYDLPKIVSIQNPYSLVNRTFEVGLSEMSIREKVGLLAYSPLGGGLLSGKYRNNQKPAGARYTDWPNYFARYKHPNTAKAVEAYYQLAQDHGLDASQMALAYINTRNFLTSNIIGATTMEQLKLNIASIDVELNQEVLDGIEKIHHNFPNPAP